jgi:hypothetical protein
MSDPITDKEIEAILSRLRNHCNDKRVGPWVGEDFEEAADLIERLHRRVAKLEKDIEAAYAEQKEGSP